MRAFARSRRRFKGKVSHGGLQRFFVRETFQSSIQNSVILSLSKDQFSGPSHSVRRCSLQTTFSVLCSPPCETFSLFPACGDAGPDLGRSALWCATLRRRIVFDLRAR